VTILGTNKILVSNDSTSTNQPQIKIGLRYQRSILHQLYDLAIMTTKSCEELERTWEDISHEE